MKTKLTSLLLACGAVAASPLVSRAQDGRPQQETVKPAEPTSRPDGERKHDDDKKREGDKKHDGDRAKHDGDKRAEHREHAKAPESKPVTYLGLMTSGLSPEVAAQAGLAEGFGLLVADIMDGSPAKEAGFQKYDVLVLIGDQRIVNIEQFQSLIRSQKKGDEVTLTVRRKGSEVKVAAKLGEHAFPAVAGHEQHRMMPPMAHGEGPGARSFNHKFADPKEHMGEMKERMEHMRDMMRERFQNRGNGERGPGPFFARPGAGPMNRDGDHKGPSASPQKGPQSKHRDDDQGNAGSPGNGPRPNGDAHRDGNRPGGENGNVGPRSGAPQRNGPHPEGEAHRDGDRPPSDQGNVGPRAGAPQPNAPRPDAQSRRDGGGRPDGEHGDRGPRASGPQGSGPRPDGPPPEGGPRPDAPRPDA